MFCNRKPPAYTLHKASGQAVVRLCGKDHYLGPYGTPSSHERYEQALLQWRNQVSPNTQSDTASSFGSSKTHELSIDEVLVAYWRFGETYYATADGQPTKELTSMRLALRPLRRLYGTTRANDFGPKALKLVREQMIADGLSRKVVNNRINRIRRFFKWAVGEELVASGVLYALQAVSPLRYGRTSARETEPVRPVTDMQIETTLPFVSPPVRAMVRLQRLTGMRPGETVIMRPCDIDRTAAVWLYEPASHKNRWRGHRRQVPLGPQAQSLLEPFLNRAPQVYLFSPREAEEIRNQERRQNRKSPMTPSQQARRPKAAPKRCKRERYDVDSYRRAIKYAIKRAGVEPWSPHQLRHSRATEVRREFGLEAAQVVMGHARADVTEVYAERNLVRASEIASLSG